MPSRVRRPWVHSPPCTRSRASYRVRCFAPPRFFVETTLARPPGRARPDYSRGPTFRRARNWHIGPSRVRPPPSRTPPADVPVLIRTQVHRPRAVRVHAQASTPGAAPAFGRKLGSAAGSGFARGSQGTSFSVLSNTLTLSRLNPRQRRRAGLARSEPFFPKKTVLTTLQHPNHTYSGTSGFISHRRVVKVRPDSRSNVGKSNSQTAPHENQKRK